MTYGPLTQPLTVESLDAQQREALGDLMAASDQEIFKAMGDMCLQLYSQGARYAPWGPKRAAYWHKSLMLFVDTFMDLPLAMPDFHRDWYYYRVRYQDYMNMGPRDHAKTTVNAVNSTVWELVMDRNLCFFIIFSTLEVAKLVMKPIKTHLSTNEKIVQTFGVFNPARLPVDERKVDLDWSKVSITIQRDDPGVKDPSVAVAGAGNNVLSRRADRLIADDMITQLVARSEAESETLDTWFWNDVYPVVKEDGQTVICGTLYGRGDFYHDILDKSTDNGGVFHCYVGDAIVDDSRDQVLWPERWSYAALMRRKLTLGSVKFNRNYRNIVLDDSDSPFPMIFFKGGVHPESGVIYPGCYDTNLTLGGGYVDGLSGRPTSRRFKMVTGGVDPAMSFSKRAKYFAMVTLGLGYNNLIYVLNIVHGKYTFVAQKRVLVDEFARFGHRAILVETNAYQDALREGALEDYPALPLFSWKTTSGKDAKPDIGVESMSVHFEHGGVRVPRATRDDEVATALLVEELHFFGSHTTSDVAMAFWFAYIFLRNELQKSGTLPAANDARGSVPSHAMSPNNVMGLAGMPIPPIMRHRAMGLAGIAPLAKFSQMDRIRRRVSSMAKKGKSVEEEKDGGGNKRSRRSYPDWDESQ